MSEQSSIPPASLGAMSIKVKLFTACEIVTRPWRKRVRFLSIFLLPSGHLTTSSREQCRNCFRIVTVHQKEMRKCCRLANASKDEETDHWIVLAVFAVHNMFSLDTGHERDAHFISIVVLLWIDG